MEQDDPEQRLAELERQWAFSEASGSQGAYHRAEVDAFVARVAATLKDPMASGGVTPAELREVAFSKPPMGKLGYDEGEVDAFLDRVKTELSGRAPGQGPEQPLRCLLYRYPSSDPTPVLAIDVGDDAIRVIDPNGNALIASASLAEVIVKPAQYGGLPVLVVDGPGLPTLTITPHPPPGQWGKWPKSKKPAYLALEAEWLTLAEKLGLASELVEEWAPQTFLEHVGRVIQEFGPHAPTTWRTPLVFGLLIGVFGALGSSLIPLVIGVVLLIVAAIAWRFKWEL